MFLLLGLTYGILFLPHINASAADGILIFSSPGQSPGRAVVLPPASANSCSLLSFEGNKA